MFRPLTASLLVHLGVAGGLWWALSADVSDFDPSGALLGDTTAVDLIGEELAFAGAEGQPSEADEAAGAEPAAPTNAAPNDRAGESPAPTPTPAPASKPARAASTKGDLGGGASDNGGMFGAVGERNAADLATAFVRGFPQVASVDPAWSKVPFGPMSNAVVEIELAEDGRIVGHQVHSAPTPLDRAIERTLGLIRGRRFTARGAKTKLVMRCRVTADTVHDGLHGDVFAVGASFTGKTGNAFFALASGRRIDVDVALGR